MRQNPIRKIYKKELISRKSDLNSTKIDPIERYKKTGLIFWEEKDTEKNPLKDFP
ncbi:MAG: hypothetical protein ACTSVC_07155 [Promethearchaeota archaeon]